MGRGRNEEVKNREDGKRSRGKQGGMRKEAGRLKWQLAVMKEKKKYEDRTISLQTARNPSHAHQKNQSYSAYLEQGMFGMFDR